jgi:hypothetical protein
VAEEVKQLTPLPSSDPELVRKRTQEVLFSALGPRDLRHTAFVEADPLQFAQIVGGNDVHGALGGEAMAIGNARITAYEPQRVEVEATLRQPGLLVLSDFYESGWRAEITASDAAALHAGQGLPVLRTNRIMRGIFLPAGTHRIQFAYRPSSFYIGAAVSVVGWAAWGLACVWICVRSWRRRG